MRIRIGKDIKIKWAVLTDGSALPLNKEELTLELAGPNGKSQSMEFEVEGNVLTAMFYGKDQNYTGDYMLTLWKNKGKEGQSVVDKTSAFSLVRYTPQEDLAQKHDNLSATLADLGDTSLVTIDGASETTLVCNLTGYKAVEDASGLPMEPSTIGYLVGDNLYVYVGEGGDTLDGKYKNCGPFRGIQGPQGNSGYQGAAGELEVVNNLTDGGEAAALSAEQGKVLDSKKQDKLNYYTENGGRAVMQASYVGMLSSEDTNEGGKESTGLYASKGVASLYYAERDAEDKVQHEDGLYLEKRRENGGGCVLLRSYNAGGANSKIQIAPEKVSITGAEAVEATAPEVSVKATGGVKFETQGTDSTSAHIEMLGGDEPDLDLHTDSNLTIFGNNSVAIESDNDISATANSNIVLNAADNISMSSSSGKIEDVVGALVSNTNAIATLTGTGKGSVTQKVTDEIAKIVDSAPEAFDTLKEIADYITEDMSGAEEMFTSLGALKLRVYELGDFPTTGDAERKAAEETISKSPSISIIHYTVNGSASHIILQDVNDAFTQQVLYYGGHTYIRHIGPNLNASWRKTNPTNIKYNQDSHRIALMHMVNQYGEGDNNIDWVELPTATTTKDGLMTKAQVQSLEGKQDKLQTYTEATDEAQIKLPNGTSRIKVGKDLAGMYAQDGKSGIINSSSGSRLVYMETATDSSGSSYTSHRDDISIGKHDGNSATHITLTSKSTTEEAGEKITNTSTIQVNPDGISMSSPNGEIGDVVKAIADKQDKLATYEETDKESASITTESDDSSVFLVMDSTTAEFDLVATDGEKSASIDADLNSIQIGVGTGDDNTGVYIEENIALLQSQNGEDIIEVHHNEEGGGIILETLGNISAQSSNGYIEDVVKEITDKAPKVGYAPELKVNFAKELVGRGEATEEVIGAIRPTGVRSIGDGNATITKIKGDSVVWNQCMNITRVYAQREDARYTITQEGIRYSITKQEGGTATLDNVFVVFRHEFKKGQKYLLRYNLRRNDGQNLGIEFSGSGIYDGTSYHDLIKTKGKDYVFFSPTSSFISALLQVGQSVTAGVALSYTIAPVIYDLTQMFGAGNEPTTIEEFEARKPLGVSNEYNEGTIVSYNGANELKSVGFNAFNGTYAKVIGGEVYHATGTTSISFAKELDGDTTAITLNDKGEFTPIEDGYVYAEGTDIVIHLTHSYTPEHVDEYEEDVHLLPNISAIKDADGNQLFPYGLLSAGSVHDEITATKAIKRVGVVDMGTLSWYSNYTSIFTSTIATMKNSTSNVLLISYDYKGYYISGIGDKGYIVNGHIVYIKDPTYTDVTSFKQAMSGVLLYYELATPIEVDLPEPLNMTYEAWDFGTEELVASQPTTPLNADIAYLFNAVDRIRENSSAIEDLEEHVEERKDDGIELLTNGNLKLTLKGETREFMPATPSGDPMHWAYVSAGAEYNDSGADIVKDAPWKDYVDTEEEKTVLHKANHWYLNGLGDLTTQEIRETYVNGRVQNINMQSLFRNQSTIRTNVRFAPTITGGTYDSATMIAMFASTSNLEVAYICNGEKVKTGSSLYIAFDYDTKLKHIMPALNVETIKDAQGSNAFNGCSSLVSVALQNIRTNWSLKASRFISKSSILYAINNATPTTAITITLHHDAYERLKGDADILQALNTKNADLANTGDGKGKVSLVCATDNDTMPSA